jgi:hypothetical protein
MNTPIYILTAIFVMNFTFLSAGNPKTNILKVNDKIDNIALSNADLAPVTPKVAFFNDVEPKPLSEIARLAPITPKEATFEDNKAEFNIQPINPFLLEKMAPVTPKEAEFEDAAVEKIPGIDSLVPTSTMAAALDE